MKNLPRVIFGLLALAIVLLLFLPTETTVSRSVNIDASPAEVYSQVNSFRQWNNWNPINNTNTEVEMIFEGESGIGHSNSWTDENAPIRRVNQKIVDSEINKNVETVIRINDNEPVNLAWNIEDAGEGTKLTLNFQTRMSRLNKLSGRVNNVNVETIFDQGLNNLKNECEHQQTRMNALRKTLKRRRAVASNKN